VHKLIAVLATTGALVAPTAAQAATPPPTFDSGLGCSADCIRSALVTPAISFARYEIKTDTPARFQVVVRKRTAMETIVDSDTSSPLPTKEYGGYVTGLEPDTLYAITVSATDAQGRTNTRYGTFRTKAPVTVVGTGGGGSLTSNAGCTAQCVRTAQVTPGMSGAEVRVQTNTPAKISVNPGQGAPVVATSAYSTDTTLKLKGLKSGRTYTVGITATDENGGVSFREGTFETLERNVRVRFMEIHVIENAEKRKSNKGEIIMHGSVNNGWQVRRPEGKVKDGARIHFKNQGEVVIEDVGPDIAFAVQGRERDTKGTCFDYILDGPYPELAGSMKINCVKKVWNTATGWFDLEGFFGDEDGSTDLKIRADRGALRFEVDVRIDVWSS
jgi:hypothetical protein